MRFLPRRPLRAAPRRGAALALLLCLLGALLAPGDLHARPDESVVVVLKDGSELMGVLVKETEESVAIRTPFGVTTIERGKISEVRRGENPWVREFRARFERAKRLRKAEAFSELGEWAGLKGLEAERERAHEEALLIDPEHEISRLALGHARVDGAWVDAVEVERLLDRGWRRAGASLLPPAGEARPAPGSARGADSGSRPSPPTPAPVAGDIDPEQEARRARLLEKRRRDREEFEAKRRLEFEGVPWSDRHRIKTRNYELHCNSTREVAESYAKIMEALYAELSKRFNQKHIRRGRLPVFIYRNQQEFMDRNGMSRNVGGFYSPRSEQVHAFYGPFGMTSTTYNVLAHEGTHQFQGRILPNMTNLNNWVIEGFAVYFGDGSRIDYKRKKIVTGLIPRDRLMVVQDRMREGTVQPLSKLAGLPRNRFGGAEYADSWSLLYFLINGPEKEKGQELIARYWLAGCEQRVGQKEFDQLAERYFGSVGELEREWKEFILALEPEPAGEVDDDGVFTSLDYMFEILGPGAGWSFQQSGLKSSELVAITPDGIEGSDHRILVKLLSKTDELQSAEAFANDVLLAGLEKRYAEVELEQVTLNEYHPFLCQWVDRDPEAGKKDAAETEEASGSDKEPEEPGPGKIPPPPEGEADAEATPPEPPPVRRRYRAYVFVGVTNAYMLQCEFPIEEFDRHVGTFEQVARSFAKIFRNRW